jgi:hypothetical protein
MKNLLILTSPCSFQRIEFLINGDFVEVTEVELDPEQGAHLAGAGDVRPHEAESQIAEYLKLGWDIYTPISPVPLDDEQTQLAYRLFVQELVMSDGYRFDLGGDREESAVNVIDQLFHAEQS